MIELTHHDLQRLVKHSGISPERLIKLYTRAELNDEDDNEDDWIVFSYGKRRMGLRKRRNGECIFLSKDRKCIAYSARPMSCRIFPINVVLDEKNRICDLELSDVIESEFIRCKYSYGKTGSFRKFLQIAKQAQTESISYWKKLEQWNEISHKGNKADFLNFLGFRIH
jgi:Fe-S-cluster containining protein